MKGRDRNAASELARLAQGQAGPLRWAAGLATLSEALWIGQAALIAMVVAALVRQDADAALGLLFGCAGFVLIGLLRAGLTAVAGARLARCGDEVTGDLRAGLLQQADRRGSFGGAASSAAIAALATDKLALLLPYLRRWPVARMRVAVIPLLMIGVALPISWAAAVVFLMTGPMIPVFMALVGLAAGRASQDRMDEIADMNALLVERLTALTDIRLLAARETMLDRFAEVADRLRSRTMRVLALAFLSSAVLELFSAIGVAMMAIFVGFSLLGVLNFGHWGQGMDLAQGVFLLMLAPAYYQPMRDLAAAWHDRADALALARDLAAERSRPSAAILGEGAPAKALPFAELRTVDLRAANRSLPDLALQRGESVALTGASGVGKSHLILMLAGLAEATPGRVLIDGRPLDAAMADRWRAGLALIPQRVHFSDDTLLANLHGSGPVSEADLAAALVLAHAGAVVDRLPEGLQTRLSEQGAGVSGGEARRLMIARAALRRPALLLADEPTADLDEATADQVIDGLLALHRGGTTLVVASHDPRLIAAMSREVAL